VAVARELLIQASNGDIVGFPIVKKWIVFGHSMGARVCLRLAVALPDVIIGCIFSSFPAHPPHAPMSQLRVGEPLSQLSLGVGVLVIHGTKDAYCCEEAYAWLKDKISPHVMAASEVQDGDHGLAVPGGSVATEAALKKVDDVMVQFVVRIAGGNRRKKRSVEQGQAYGIAHPRRKIPKPELFTISS